jgi:hypothetical protein
MAIPKKPSKSKPPTKTGSPPNRKFAPKAPGGGKTPPPDYRPKKG